MRGAYTRRRFFGRQPLCGSGVTSSIDLIFKPAACSAVIATFAPAPRPFHLHVDFLHAELDRLLGHLLGRHGPAKGVLLRLPLKPLVPALAQQSVSPLVSVMVIIVLLNVALMSATPTVTLRRALRRVPWSTLDNVLATVIDP